LERASEVGLAAGAEAAALGGFEKPSKQPNPPVKLKVPARAWPHLPEEKYRNRLVPSPECACCANGRSRSCAQVAP
jgi:hypothetical protein